MKVLETMKPAMKAKQIMMEFAMDLTWKHDAFEGDFVKYSAAASQLHCSRNVEVWVRFGDIGGSDIVVGIEWGTDTEWGVSAVPVCSPQCNLSQTMQSSALSYTAQVESTLSRKLEWQDVQKQYTEATKSLSCIGV